MVNRLSRVLHLSPGYLAIIAAHTIWGINFLAAKITLQEFPPFSLSFLRFFIALILLIPFLLIERKKIQISISDLPYFILVGSLMTTFNIALFYEGLIRTSAIDASVLSMVVPIISVILGWSVLKEKIYTINLVGIVFGLIGSVIILGLPQAFAGKELSTTQLYGNLLLIISSVLFVVGAAVSKVRLKKYPALTITMMLFLVASVIFFIPALNEYLKNPGWVNQVSILGIFGLLFIVIASSISAFFLFEWGVMKLGVVKADLFQYLEPLIATTLAVLVLGEPLHYSLIIGGVLIGLGVYWGTLGKENHKGRKAHRQ